MLSSARSNRRSLGVAVIVPLLVGLVLIAGPPPSAVADSPRAASAEQPPPASTTRRHTFRLHHRSPTEVMPKLRGHLSPQGQLIWGPTNALTVLDRPDVLRRLERVVSALDVPYRTYKVHVRLLRAYEKLPEPPRPPKALGLDRVHDRLLDLHHRLMKLFKFEGYTELDALEIEVREGRESSARTRQGYEISLRLTPAEASDQGDGQQEVVLEDFELKDDRGRRLVSTDLKVGLGKTAFVGKSIKSAEGDALIAVVTVDPETEGP